MLGQGLVLVLGWSWLELVLGSGLFLELGWGVRTNVRAGDSSSVRVTVSFRVRVGLGPMLELAGVRVRDSLRVRVEG